MASPGRPLRARPPVRRAAIRGGSHRRRPHPQTGTGAESGGPWSTSLLPGGRFPSRLLDRLPNARIGATAADVPRHCLVDIGVGGRGHLREQRRGGHDLAGLTVAALNDLEAEPGLLNALAHGSIADRLDGRDGLPDGGAHRHHAGPPRDAVQVHGAGAAQCIALPPIAHSWWRPVASSKPSISSTRFLLPATLGHLRISPGIVEWPPARSRHWA